MGRLNREEILKKVEREGDSLDFEAWGLRCHIHRHSETGHLNGYVRVPVGHRFHGVGYSEALCGHPGCYRHSLESLITVHGGLTYSGEAYWEEDEEGWWFGFDTAHAGDYLPFLGFPLTSSEKYRDMEYVKKECESLARQLQELQSYGEEEATGVFAHD